MQVLFNFILSCGIGIIIFMLIPLFKIKNKSIQDKLLIAIIIVISNYLCLVYSINNNLNFLTACLFVLSDPIEFILGPLIYVYVKSLISNHQNLINRYSKHFIPALLYLVTVTIPLFISYSKENYIFNYLKILDSDNEKLLPVIYMLFLNSYILLALIAFNKYESKLKNQFSTIHKHKSIWIKRMITGVLLVCLTDLLVLIVNLIFSIKADITEYTTPLASVIFMYYLAYNAINKTKLLIPVENKLANSNIKIPSPKKNLLFNEQEIITYKKLIHQYLEIEQLYLDENLSLLSLSKKIGISDKKLSSYINNILKTTFYDLINQFRINAVKNKLTNPKYNDLTIIAIANDCGFKSKTTFNRIFKKETNMLPSQYKKNYQKSLQKSTIASFEPLETSQNL